MYSCSNAMFLIVNFKMFANHKNHMRRQHKAAEGLERKPFLGFAAAPTSHPGQLLRGRSGGTALSFVLQLLEIMCRVLNCCQSKEAQEG